MQNYKMKLPHIMAALIIFLLASSVFAASREQYVGAPPPDTRSQIIQNKGNITTTVDNWGYMGGYRLYNLPSGEWPRNSGHNYIGEMKYWLGAVTPGGDTIVADSDEDFRPIQSLIHGIPSYDIHLSTDTTSYDYDPTDTVGLGLGNPAYGWRVWNPDSNAWVYNQIYSTVDSAFYPGGPTGQQQSVYRFDDRLTINSLGLEMAQSIYQWNYCYNENILFVVLSITNVSGVDYTEFAVGAYCDFDVGGPDGSGENGRLGDLVASDSSLNLAWTYDEDGYDPGWGPLVRTGIMGTKYLETPDNIGMTAFRTGQWEYLPDNDPGKYEFLNSTQFDVSLPPTDQYYLQCTRGINLEAGKTVRIVYAIVAGKNLEDFYNNAATAQTLYDNHYIGPQPPATPTLSVRAGNNKVFLSWDKAAELSADPMTGDNDFSGYKLYRSTNQGYTWGFASDASSACQTVDYQPIAMYQIENFGEPIAHSFIDSNLTNGMEYWYCLVAYDKGDTTVPIDPLQTGFGIPGSDANVVQVTPRSDPAGYINAIATVKHEFSGAGEPSDGQIVPLLFDGSWIPGQEYSVVFADVGLETQWFLINNVTGDTLLKDQTAISGDPKDYEIANGLQVIVTDGETVPRSIAQTGFAVAGDTTLHLGPFYTMADGFGLPACGQASYRAAYELRFTESGSIGYDIMDDVTPITLPFEVWNITENYQVLAEIYDLDADLVYDPADRDYIDIVDVPYDGSPHPEAFPFSHVWLFRFGATDTNYTTGDVFSVAGAPLNGPDDIFTFKTEDINASNARVDMKKIRVVPDPYIVHAVWETDKFVRKLEFVNLPELCTVRIYSLSGDLVNTLNHTNGTGTESWNLLSESGLGIAPGVYLYHVESTYGNRIGRFAVVK
jgi:hypothetical protein